jgi:hypothetical protein
LGSNPALTSLAPTLLVPPGKARVWPETAGLDEEERSAWDVEVLLLAP